jgi:hypothetical protein
MSRTQPVAFCLVFDKERRSGPIITVQLANGIPLWEDTTDIQQNELPVLQMDDLNWPSILSGFLK